MKKFSYNGIASNMTTNSTTEVTLVGDIYEGTTLNVMRYIDMNTMLAIVNSTVNAIADTDDATYQPELTECVLRMMVLNAYAGCPIPENIKKAYRVLMQSDLYEQVVAHIDPEQLETIRTAVMDKVEYNRTLILNALGHKMYDVIGQFNSVLDALNNMAGQFDSEDFKQAISAINTMNNSTAPSQEADRIAIEVDDDEQNVVPIKSNLN